MGHRFIRKMTEWARRCGGLLGNKLSCISWCPSKYHFEACGSLLPWKIPVMMTKGAPIHQLVWMVQLKLAIDIVFCITPPELVLNSAINPASVPAFWQVKLGNCVWQHIWRGAQCPFAGFIALGGGQPVYHPVQSCFSCQTLCLVRFNPISVLLCQSC